MRLKAWLTIYAVIGVVYTLGLLVVPRALLSLYGIAPSPEADLMARYFGAALAGVTLVAWWSRGVADPAALRPVLFAFLASEVLAALVSVQGTVSGVLNAFGWVGAGLSALLALGFAYFLFSRREAHE